MPEGANAPARGERTTWGQKNLGLPSLRIFLANFLWLAEISQQLVNQTTWQKVSPHCNHCN
jgi:hypothetical protein